MLHNHRSLEEVLVKTRRGAGEDTSDSPRGFLCSFPSSGWSRIKVDVLRTIQPDKLIVPHAIKKMKYSQILGVNTSFALRFLAWISDASICSNSSMFLTRMSPFQVPPRVLCVAEK